MTAGRDEFESFPGGRAAWWMALVVLLALVATRYQAAWFSYALDGYSDEPVVVDSALAAARGVLRPDGYVYPRWTAYSVGAVYKLLDVAGFGGDAGFLPQQASPDHLVVARLFVFAVSLATLVVTALTGRRLAGAWCGLAAAVLLACSPMFTGMSFLVTINPPASLWTALAVFFALRVYLDGRRPRDYIASAVCAGLAVACKYNAYPATFALACAHVLAPRAADGMRHRWLLIAAVVAPLVFFACNPFALVDLEQFLGAVRFLGDVYEKEWPLHYNESGSSWSDYVVRMFRFGWPYELSVAALLGTLVLLRRDWKRVPILAIAPMANFVFLGFYAVFFLRHLLPALPALALTSGVLVQACAELAARRAGASASPRARAWLATAVASVLIAGLGARALVESQTRVAHATLVDSRQAALEWMLENLPAGSRIVREDRTPEIEQHSSDYEVQVIRSIAQPDRTREAERADFVVLSGVYDRVMRDPKFAAARQAYKDFAARHELVREFKGEGVEYSGRDIRIYRIDRASAEARAGEAPRVGSELDDESRDAATTPEDAAPPRQRKDRRN